jgi:predicted TIM-barrel fold metal-dependent hydrolase
MDLTIIDAHTHCGIQDQSMLQSFDAYRLQIQGSGIEAVVMFSPVMEIYDRYRPNFEDNADWQQKRKTSNEHLLTVGSSDLKVIPYFFIWNDFAVDQLKPQHKGIKWHRHPHEPIYHYDDPQCRKAIDEIKRRNMPVVLEEEFENTIRFINELAIGVKVIIPHLGLLNGGYHAFAEKGIWDNPNVYADTALALPYDIKDYIDNFGHERILFGSDFPFGDPKAELSKILKLSIAQEKKEMILGLNLKRLVANSNRAERGRQ